MRELAQQFEMILRDGESMPAIESLSFFAGRYGSAEAPIADRLMDFDEACGIDGKDEH